MKPFLFLFALLLVVSSCAGPIETIESTGPDGKRKVVVSGERKVPGDPVMVKVHLEVPGGQKDFFFEHQATYLTKENCTIVWNSPTTATLTLVMTDGVKQIVDMTLQDSLVHAIKVITPP